MEKITKTLELPDGSKVVLLDSLGIAGAMPVESSRNIVLLDSQGQTVWRVSSAFDASGDPFTNIILEGSVLKGYRWDGGMYAIDQTTGKATPAQLSR